MTLLKQYTGCARFAWNWALGKEQEFYKKDIPFHSAIDLHVIWCVVKYADENLRWSQNISKQVPQNAFRDLERAFKDFFKENKGYPNFKKKKEGFGSFRIDTGVEIESDKIYISKFGWIKLKEKNYIPQTECCFITVSEDTGRWFISVTFEEDITIPENKGPVIGIDLGIKTLAKTSENITYENPKVLSKYEKKLKRLHREVSRKKKGSNNRRKSIKKLQKIYKKISNIRKDNINKITTKLAKTKSVIVIEDLKIKKMMTDQRNINKSMLDVSWYEFRRQLTYKTQWYGSKLIIAPKYYPSSKLCSDCGYINNNLELTERTYHCPKCHLQIDRDLNAAINLSRLATSSEESINACLKQEVTGQNLKILYPVPANDSRIEHKISERRFL
jgi:putative transposase